MASSSSLIEFRNPPDEENSLAVLFSDGSIFDLHYNSSRSRT